MRKEVIELREKFGELKGRVETLLEVMDQDLIIFKDGLNRDPRYSLEWLFAEIDQKSCPNECRYQGVTCGSGSLGSKYTNFTEPIF